MENPPTKWEEEDYWLLAVNYESKTLDELALLLGKAKNTIIIRAKELGFNKLNPWTEEEIAMLKEYGEGSTARELQEKFFPERTCGDIRMKLNRLGPGRTR